MNNKRKAEIKQDDQWVSIPFQDLKKGDTFRLFEPTGEKVIAIVSEFVANSDAYINKDNIWTILTMLPEDTNDAYASVL